VYEAILAIAGAAERCIRSHFPLKYQDISRTFSYCGAPLRDRLLLRPLLYSARSVGWGFPESINEANLGFVRYFPIGHNRL